MKNARKISYSSEVARDVYHTTKLEKLKSFITKGADSTIAKGYGQGEGFYVWTTLKKAIIHSRFLRRSSNSDNVYVILKFHEIIDAKNWDLDYECNALFASAFVSGHWQLFKKIPDKLLSFNYDGREYFIIPSSSEKIKPFGPTSLFIRIRYQEKGSDKVNKYDIGIGKTVRESESILSAAIIGTIFNYFQKTFSKKTTRFEINFFKKISKRGVAIKYVGKVPLKVKSYKLVVNDKLLSNKKCEKYLKEHNIEI